MQQLQAFTKICVLALTIPFVLAMARDSSAQATDEAGEEAPQEVHLTAKQTKLIGLKTSIAEQAPVMVDLILNGEVTANQDRTIEVLPRTAGIVREVIKNLGDRVTANEPLAIIESRELTDGVAAYLAAQSKSDLARNQAQRDENLWRQKIGSEQDYLTSKQAATAAEIDLRAAEQKLGLVGVDVGTIREHGVESVDPVRVPVLAPFDGTIIEKKVAIGDQVNDQTPLFRIANLDKVWVIASVFEQDMGKVAVGQMATVTLRAYPDRTFQGKVTWVSEVLDEKTRTLSARVELDNSDRLLKPGSFARVVIKIPTNEKGVAVPASAIQHQKSESIVFVDAGDGRYERREVKLGDASQDAVEVVDGLKPGETVVTDGSFLLKSELDKSSLADQD
jgi:cobalt-zinc-cadmium efflux system membrane fusion protein